MSIICHLTQILRHKWYVFIAGWRLKVPLWRLLTHDLSKFSPAEFGAYARQFHGDKGDPMGFAHAWLHHQHHNAHHWEYWIGSSAHNKSPLLDGIDDGHVLPMPESAVREMVADWLAAGKVYNGAWPDPNHWTWFKENRHKMQMHLTTWARLFVVLEEAAGLKW